MSTTRHGKTKKTNPRDSPAHNDNWDPKKARNGGVKQNNQVPEDIRNGGAKKNNNHVSEATRNGGAEKKRTGWRTPATVDRPKEKSSRSKKTLQRRL